MEESEIISKIIEVGRRLHDRHLLAACDGNISFRLSDREILITPSGVNKAFLTPDQMAMITLDNDVVRGVPSSERKMHLEIYRACHEARCVVHAHPPAAIAWTVARPKLRQLPFEILPEVILAAGRLPIVPYARPSTEEVGAGLRSFLPKYRVLILARHGVVSWGESLEEAYNGIERVEHVAHILKLASELGRLSALPKREIRVLEAMRAKIGARTL